MRSGLWLMQYLHGFNMISAPEAERVIADQIIERRTTQNVLGVPFDVVSWEDAVDRIIRWSAARESRVVSVCNVHGVVTALQNEAHAQTIREADLVTPDGAPVAWVLRRKGHPGQERISGPDLMLKCCRRAAEVGEKIFLYGGSPTTLSRLERELRMQFPTLDIVGAVSPPFRELTAEEGAAMIDTINQSGAGIVWVGLGCPKQEAWMHAHRGKINAVMVGVGAAFDFHAGVIKRAPVRMQRYGLEWLHRMLQEPRRLTGRYLITNTRFVIALVQDMALPNRMTRTGSPKRNPANHSNRA